MARTNIKLNRPVANAPAEAEEGDATGAIPLDGEIDSAPALPEVDIPEEPAVE